MMIERRAKLALRAAACYIKEEQITDGGASAERGRKFALRPRNLTRVMPPQEVRKPRLPRPPQKIFLFIQHGKANRNDPV